MRRPGPRLVCCCVVLAVTGAVAPVATAAPTAPPPDDDADNPCVGTMAEPADAMTVVSVQGYNPDGTDRPRVVGVGPDGEIEWVHRNGVEMGATWSYDIDPLDDGYLFVTATFKRDGEPWSAFYKLDARTGEVVWLEELQLHDTHDADLLDEHRIVIANMRAYDEETDENSAGLLIYNRTSDEVEWEWDFDDHYDRDVGGPYEEDWTHLNDVDRVGEDKFIASPRNFDQVVLLNQTTGEIELTLGEDGNFDVMERQHQPDYLESEDGDPTFLVADSGNDRIVEYEHTDDGWENTWNLSGDMRWTRDADRLPNGNTLIADTVKDRVIEVTPEGEVVWEVYTPHHVYEVERIDTGDESSGPTMADVDAPEDVELHGDTDFTPPQVDACERYLTEFENEWPGRPNATTPGENGSDGSPALGDGTRETPTSAPTTEASADGGSGLPGAGALLALAGLLLALTLARRQRR